MRLPLTLLVLSLTVISAAWSWLGRPKQLPPWPLAAGEKLHCVSYTPFQPGQSPFDAGLIVSPSAIAADLKRLAPLTDCIRTYSAASNGIDAVAAAAESQGLHVLQGAWISRDPIANAAEIDAALAAAKRYPETVKALIAGNEVLLRREQTAAQLAALLRNAKSRSNVPVTYADVWEFWLQNPSLADDVDYLTIHILPYWEDNPVAAEDAAQHVLEITKLVQASFPGKVVMIGEVGWPSAGRMRDAARPSPYNQARVITDVIAATRKAGINANIIEAFDQPWKRRLEGTVGGHWGLFDSYNREPKFEPGRAVSDFRHSGLQALSSVLIAILAYLTAVIAARRLTNPVPAWRWGLGAFNITAGCLLFGLAISPLFDSAFGGGGMARSLALGLMTVFASLQSAAIVTATKPASFASLLGTAPKPTSNLSKFSGLFLMSAALMAITASLTLTFDARYAELPFAVFLAVTIASVCLTIGAPHRITSSANRVAETFTAVLIGMAGLFVAINEGPANWQALLLAASFVVLAAAIAWPLTAARTQAH